MWITKLVFTLMPSLLNYLEADNEHVLRTRLSILLTTNTHVVSASATQQGYLTEASGTGLDGAMIRLVTKDKQRNKMSNFRKDQHSENCPEWRLTSYRLLLFYSPNNIGNRTTEKNKWWVPRLCLIKRAITHFLDAKDRHSFLTLSASRFIGWTNIKQRTGQTTVCSWDALLKR